jgi:DNA-directed RNA polymerase alpha subunit
MTNEQLLDIDELMASGDNTARHYRAMELYTAAKLERKQGNRELADRLKAVGNRLMHKNYKATHPPEQKIAALTILAESATRILARTPFQNRGFSDRTINALVAKGIDAPERLLFATEAELRRIPGVGPVSLAEITHYRARFLVGPKG